MWIAVISDYREGGGVRVFIKHKQREGQPTITIAQVQTASGATVKVGLPGINPRKETLLGDSLPDICNITFPKASAKQGVPQSERFRRAL